jgi:small subunit ribosomal protein S17
MAKKKKEETTEALENTEQSEQQEEQPGVVESVIETVSAAASSVVEAATNAVETATSALGLSDETASQGQVGRRAQKVGTVSSDKMTKTVVVNVDRKVMHPKYRRYVRRTSKFMAHDEMTAGIGDKVRIEETRPMSARKRWRVIEIIQKAAK